LSRIDDNIALNRDFDGFFSPGKPDEVGGHLSRPSSINADASTQRASS
jgi:hypothetical protein